MGLGPESGSAEQPASRGSARPCQPGWIRLRQGFLEQRKRGGSEPAPRPAGEFPQLAALARGAISLLRAGAGGRRSGAPGRAQPAMARERLPGRGCCALRRCLLAAALLLGLRLCAELQRAGPQPPALSSPPGQAPRPPGSHLQPAPGQLRGASRRQVTYVRSGRRAPARGGRSGTPEPGCCALRGRPRLKVSCKRCNLGL